uniref:Uncharacterized protein n=2 Tax=viral metagenome TaxID=1070528 RepID=A0A6M3M5Q8_9ZZZZ
MSIKYIKERLKAHVKEAGPLRDNGEIYDGVEVITERITDQAAAVEALIDAGAPVTMLSTTKTALTTYLRGAEVDEPRAECDPDGFVEFSIDFHGAGLRYYDLCPRCDKTLKRLWTQAQPTDAKRKGEEVAP